MDFCILGPMEVRDGERTVALGGAKQRALLALLLLHANEPVSMDHLIGRRCGRRALRRRGSSRCTSRCRGCDARWERTASSSRGRRAISCCSRPVSSTPRASSAVSTRARRALARGDADTASRALHEGLALWRGPPLTDLHYHDAGQADIARLEELRLGAQEDLADAELALGRHSEVVGDLERLVAEAPLRERLRGQLMLALYRSGRQAEALEVYREARRAARGGARGRTTARAAADAPPGARTGPRPRPSAGRPACRRATGSSGREAELALLDDVDPRSVDGPWPARARQR